MILTINIFDWSYVSEPFKFIFLFYHLPNKNTFFFGSYLSYSRLREYNLILFN